MVTTLFLQVIQQLLTMKKATQRIPAVRRAAEYHHLVSSCIRLSSNSSWFLLRITTTFLLIAKLFQKRHHDSFRWWYATHTPLSWTCVWFSVNVTLSLFLSRRRVWSMPLLLLFAVALLMPLFTFCRLLSLERSFFFVFGFVFSAAQLYFSYMWKFFFLLLWPSICFLHTKFFVENCEAKNSRFGDGVLSTSARIFVGRGNGVPPTYIPS